MVCLQNMTYITWAHLWKMNFKLDPSKWVREITFILRIKVTAPPQILFNNNLVHQILSKKPCGFFLNVKLSLLEHFEKMFIKIKKPKEYCKNSKVLSLNDHFWWFLIFFRPHIDYGDIIYDKVYSAYFQQKLESIQ